MYATGNLVEKSLILHRINIGFIFTGMIVLEHNGCLVDFMDMWSLLENYQFGMFSPLTSLKVEANLKSILKIYSCRKCFFHKNGSN